jgi:hypothetical protein
MIITAGARTANGVRIGTGATPDLTEDDAVDRSIRPKKLIDYIGPFNQNFQISKFQRHDNISSFNDYFLLVLMFKHWNIGTNLFL